MNPCLIDPIYSPDLRYEPPLYMHSIDKLLAKKNQKIMHNAPGPTKELT